MDCTFVKHETSVKNLMGVLYEHKHCKSYRLQFYYVGYVFNVVFLSAAACSVREQILA